MMTTTNSTLERRVAGCGFDGCDSLFHDDLAAAQAWHHKVESDGDGVMLLQMIVDDEGRAYGDILADFDDDTYSDMTADQVRALAEKLEGEPARLRALADRIDQRNA
jgi:hypothetical protein